MKAFIFDQDAYLQRINYTGEVDATIEHLSAIHHAQFYTIPFENFDIFLDRPIHLEPEKLFQKMVLHRRGGYCYELNGLFLMALNSFGFDARALLGRVHVTGSPTGRGHQISLITLHGEQWIADVGFGSTTPRVPIPLKFNHPITHDGQTSRLIEDKHFGIMFQIKQNAHWEDLYSFDLGYVFPGDIDYGNYFNSTSPDSLFTNARVAALPIVDGVATLFNDTLKRTVNGEETETQLSADQSYVAALQTHFGIELNVPYAALKPFNVSRS
jgi:N-hydroxyarylamine O-acetyltransferase